MSIIPVSRLSISELRSLGHNVLPSVVHDRLCTRAINRSLSLHDESVRRMYRRAGTSKAARLSGQRAA